MRCVLRTVTLFLFLLLILPFSIVKGSEPDSGILTVSETCINPLYQDLISESDLITASRRYLSHAAEPEYTNDLAAAAAILRENLKTRQEFTSIYFYIETDHHDEEQIRELIRTIAQEAMAHTGNPTEGDSLLWQFAGWKSTANGFASDGIYYWTINYTFTYYTTAEDEALLNETVAYILSQLDITWGTDYQKVKAVYDYICSHVTYDYEHLDEPAHKYQFTAYAALTQNTAVCQGFSLAFYRLALELGVDCRLIPGESRGTNHGWNIVRVDNLYYNLDSTWDAGRTDYQHFLKSKLNFPDHYRQTDYESNSFQNRYPMALLDYEPTAQDTCSHSFLEQTVSPTCTKEGSTSLVCQHCGLSHLLSRAEPLGHSWDAGFVDQPPTETADGWYTYSCITCGAQKSETIPELDNVYRISGENRYETAFKTADLLKKQLVVDKFSCIVVASGTTFADALSGSYLASINHAPILLVNQYTVQEVTDYIFANTYPESQIYILGGEAAVPSELDQLLAEEFRVKRLAGQNRYETNLAILAETGLEANGIFICTGKEFADSLSVSALRRPILLVNKTLSGEQKQLLDTASHNAIYIIGGTNAVSVEIESELSSYGDGHMERIYGDNRYQTSCKVTERFFPESAENLVLVYGHKYPDGLCGGVLAYSLNAPMLLVREQNQDHAIQYASQRNISTGAVLGGTGLISDDTLRKILQISPEQEILQ